MSRVDAVWDTYPDQSIKAQTQGKKGDGQKRKLAPQTPMPNDWHNFLKNRENKMQLFNILGDALVQSQLNKTLVTTKGDAVLTNAAIDVNDLMQCNHTEADT